MLEIQYPISFQFKISTLSNDFTATDSYGNTIAFVKQKMFKLKEDVLVYNNESKTEINYRIKADRWLDFSAAYAFTDKHGKEFGKIVRKGWKSIWKAQYEIIDEKNNVQYTINEENAWVKVFDSLVGDVPVLGFFTGYLFNPTYLVSNAKNKNIIKLKKQPSLFGRKFLVDKIGEVDYNDEDRIMLGLMMMILLERNRG